MPQIRQHLNLICKSYEGFRLPAVLGVPTLHILKAKAKIFIYIYFLTNPTI